MRQRRGDWRRTWMLAIFVLAGAGLEGCGYQLAARRTTSAAPPPAEAPKAEVPKAEAPKADDPKAEAPKKAEKVRASKPRRESKPARVEEAPQKTARAPRKEKPARGFQADVLDAREQSELLPQQAYWPYRIGQLYAENDSLGEAEAALKTALARDPAYPPALSLLSKLYFRAGRHADAVALLEPVRARPETYPEELRKLLLAGLALHYDAIGRFDLAQAAAGTASHGDPGRAGSALVYVRLRGDHPDSAAALARAVVKDDSRSAANQNNYGITRLRAGDPEAARRAFREAIERDPALPGPYYNLAIVEKYFFFDDASANRWFAAYWTRSHDDPDNLAPDFRGAVAGETPKEGER